VGEVGSQGGAVKSKVQRVRFLTLCLVNATIVDDDVNG